MTVPLVSILMVARNAAPYIDAALSSARAQSLGDIEIVVVDDGSTDGTAQVVARHADGDSRVRLLEGPSRGLSAVRNASLAAARGRFAIILDSDDLLHPRHVEWLMADQARHGVEICAGNMVEFLEKGRTLSTRTFAAGAAWQQARAIATEEYVERGMIGSRDVSLGYLKPSFELAFLRAHRITYDERLRIGEDFDLVLRAMLAGARYRYLPQATYYYRKHAGSISHRLARADLEALLRATQAYNRLAGGPVAAGLQARRRNLEGALLHLDVIAEIKAGRAIRALRLVAGHRDARELTLSSFYEGALKRLHLPLPGNRTTRRAAPADGEALADRLARIAHSSQPTAVTR